MLPLYRDTTRVALVEEQFYIAKFPLPHHKKLKPQIIIRIIKASVLPGRYQEKECSCFDFLAHSMFIFGVFCGSLCTSIFDNSSLAAKKTWSRIHSRLYFRFLWLWLKFVVMNSVVIFLCLLFYFSMTRQFFFCFFVLFFVKESLYSAIIKFNKQSGKTTERLTFTGMCIRTYYSKGSIIERSSGKINWNIGNKRVNESIVSLMCHLLQSWK